MQNTEKGTVCWSLCWISFYICASHAAFGEYAPHSPRDYPFEFVSLQNMNLIMSCPAHAHGTLEEAAEKLKQMVADQPEGRKASVWVCRANQLHTLEVIGPLADSMLLNTMAFTSEVPPEPNELLWPGFDHPFVNHIRQLRKVPDTRNLYAIINLTGDFTSFFEKRRPSFEEIKWMTLAAIGSDFQGVNWRNHHSACTFTDQVRQLEEQVRVYGEDLGKAVPVGWVADNKQVPVSARASEKHLYVIALNPDYFKLSQKSKQVALPISLDPLAGQLDIYLPEGVSVIRGQTLSGRAVDLKSGEGYLRGDYSFYGGGEMMVFELQRENK